MSVFWSAWVTVISLGCWLFIFAVLMYVLRNRPKLEEDETTGHSYDGISEYDKPMPKWWLRVFGASMIWGLVYMALFPSILPGFWHGLTTVEVDGQSRAWTSKDELASELEQNDRVFRENFAQTILQSAGAQEATPILASLHNLQEARKKPDAKIDELQKQIDDAVKSLKPFVEKMANDPAALQVGAQLFLQNCSVCHGSNAKGAKGYPNLTDNDWLYGGNADDILLTIHNGRIGGMPAWQPQIGESGVRAAAEYVLSISGNPHGYQLDQTLVNQGKALFTQNCVLCHGEDAKGLTEMGAPNLTDEIWLYGSDRDTVQTTLRHGRAGVMPAWQSRLGNERIMLLAAYVKSLSQNPQP